MAGSEIIIRRATAEDALAIGAIYNHYVEHSIATFQLEPHTDTYWHKWFTQFGDAGPHQILLAMASDEVVGFVYSLPYSEKGGYDRTVLTSVYTQDGHGGRGLGTRLYDALLSELAKTDLHRIYALIALPNDVSVALHEKLGFAQVGLMTDIGFKFGDYIDVAILELDPILRRGDRLC